jgi:hypothetical protein
MGLQDDVQARTESVKPNVFHQGTEQMLGFPSMALPPGVPADRFLPTFLRLLSALSRSLLYQRPKLQTVLARLSATVPFGQQKGREACFPPFSVAPGAQMLGM